jgi:hypothetical protein
MVKFLDSLPEVFRERYLNTHERYLKSIADIIGHLYMRKVDDWDEACRQMLLRLISAGRTPRRDDSEDETVHFRNLRNCWYHECALHYPLDNIDERLRFAAWKIVQSYYSVFSSIATLVCLEHPKRKSHDAVLNSYVSDFVCSKKLNRFFLPPVNFYLNQQGVFSSNFSKLVSWDHADAYHIPNIKACLEFAKSELEKERYERFSLVRIGIPHYLKTLRDWVTYQDAYLFFRLYGQTVKDNLDGCLKRIAFAHCVQTEFFMLKTFGWDALNLQFERFAGELKRNLKIDSPTLANRFKVYSESRALFEA